MKGFNNGTDWKKYFQQFMHNENFMFDFKEMFGDLSSFPHTNIYHTENECIIVASLPGVEDINDIHINVNYRTLALSGHISLSYEGFQLVKTELHSGHFERTYELPYPIREDKINAHYQRGLLFIHLYRSFPTTKKSSHVLIKNLDDE